MLNIVEIASKHFVVYLDCKVEKQLKEWANKRGLNAVQGLRVAIENGLSDNVKADKSSLDIV